MSRSMQVFLLCATAVATAAIRLPWAAELPTEWDVANYLLAIEQFDVHQHRPHAPGYPIYVMAARGMTWLCGSPHLALVLLSALLSGLAVPATWLLARQFLSRGDAWWVAIAAAFNPLTWFYASVGLSGIAESLFVPLVLWLGVEALRGDARAFVVGSAALAIAGGFRQNVLVFLLPVWALITLRAQLGWRARTAGVAAGATALLAWLVPMLVSAGGLSGYLQASDYLDATFATDSFVHTRSLRVLAGNLLRFASSASMALAPAGVLGVALWLLRRGRTRSDDAGAPAPTGTWVLVVALLAPMAFFVLVYFHKKAYALVLLAPALVLAMRGLNALAPNVRTAVLAGSLVLANVAYFALPADESLTVLASGQVTPSDALPARERLLRHWLMPTRASLLARDRRIAATDDVVLAQLTRHPDLVLVVPGDQRYDVRTLMQRWPNVPIWALPGEPSGEVGFARDGHLSHLGRAAFDDAVRETPSLWLCELDAPELQPPHDPAAETFAGPHHHLVLLPPLDAR